MRKTIGLATALAVIAGAAGVGAAVDDELKGSDTLEVVTEIVLENCPAAAPLQYIGGGSSSGEKAMVAATQVIAPMSRALGSRACRAPDPREAENRALAFDGIVVPLDIDNTQCASDAIAYESDPGTGEGCFTVTDQNGVPGLDCPDCEADGVTYCIGDYTDVLRIVFGGMTKNAGDSVANKDCNSDVRHSLVNNFGALFDGGCTAGECTQLMHAFRRADLSGTTDTFLSLLDLDSIGNVPFCNGTESEDLDPIRRPCEADDEVCQVDGTTGLVLPIFVPEFTEPFEITVAYPSKSCSQGVFQLAPAYTSLLPGGGTRFECPEVVTPPGTTGFSIAGFCLAPVTAASEFDCLNTATNPNVFTPAGGDSRVFNKYLREAAGDIVPDGNDNPIIASYYRIRQDACTLESSTLNIGCLNGDYPCTIGFAGREATSDPLTVTEAKPLAINGVFPTTEPAPGTIRDGSYPLSRLLYVNTLLGFENLPTDPANPESLENALAVCFNDQTIVDNAAISAGFVTLNAPPFCVDFDELNGCNSLACEADGDCGNLGTCVGGVCTMTCTDTVDCTLGRECVGGVCQFTTNTSACD
jgi:ABC-type phosphate transport system substrate-binding protein